MSEILTVEDIRRSSWREDLEERQNYEHKRRKRELAKEHEQQQARKAREAAEKQQAASSDWYAAVDTRIRAHFRDWAWAAIDERIEQWWKVHSEPLKDGIGGALGATRERVRKEFKGAIEELVQEIGAKLAALEERFGSVTPAALSPWVDSRVKAMLAHEQD